MVALEPQRKNIARIKALIRERGYPARMIAEHLGIHESRLSRYLRGENLSSRRLGAAVVSERLGELEGPLGEELLRRWVRARAAKRFIRYTDTFTLEEILAHVEKSLEDEVQAYRRAVQTRAKRLGF